MRHQRHSAITVTRRKLIIAVGSNEKSAYGSPGRTLNAAIQRLDDLGMRVKVASSVYVTTPVGGGRQPDFFNAVVMAELTMGLSTVLRLLKCLEREAGRRLGRHWGPRPLDLDILDAGVIVGRPGRGRRPAGRLILPHPEMHRRAFVLVPLAEIAPHWRHPRLDRGIQCLLQNRQVRTQSRNVRRMLTARHLEFVR